MYQKIVGKRVKIVYRDGKLISVTTGEVKSYSEELTTLEIINDKNNQSLFLQAKDINKLEVEE